MSPADAEFPRFYKAGDAVVLPTRGEGWGRPQVEAMAMGLPVISTNWSGITGAASRAAAGILHAVVP
jgi:glycosyltransferase involved in cell wall biosynthesis